MRPKPRENGTSTHALKIPGEDGSTMQHQGSTVTDTSLGFKETSQRSPKLMMRGNSGASEGSTIGNIQAESSVRNVPFTQLLQKSIGTANIVQSQQAGKELSESSVKSNTAETPFKKQKKRALIYHCGVCKASLMNKDDASKHMTSAHNIPCPVDSPTDNAKEMSTVSLIELCSSQSKNRRKCFLFPDFDVLSQSLPLLHSSLQMNRGGADTPGKVNSTDMSSDHGLTDSEDSACAVTDWTMVNALRDPKYVCSICRTHCVSLGTCRVHMWIAHGRRPLLSTSKLLPATNPLQMSELVSPEGTLERIGHDNEARPTQYFLCSICEERFLCLDSCTHHMHKEHFQEPAREAMRRREALGMKMRRSWHWTDDILVRSGHKKKVHCVKKEEHERQISTDHLLKLSQCLLAVQDSDEETNCHDEVPEVDQECSEDEAALDMGDEDQNNSDNQHLDELDRKPSDNDTCFDQVVFKYRCSICLAMFASVGECGKHMVNVHLPGDKQRRTINEQTGLYMVPSDEQRTNKISQHFIDRSHIQALKGHCSGGREKVQASGENEEVLMSVDMPEEEEGLQSEEPIETLEKDKCDLEPATSTVQSTNRRKENCKPRFDVEKKRLRRMKRRERMRKLRLKQKEEKRRKLLESEPPEERTMREMKEEKKQRNREQRGRPITFHLCTSCFEIFENGKHLRTHVFNKHCGEGSLRCWQCINYIKRPDEQKYKEIIEEVTALKEKILAGCRKTGTLQMKHYCECVICGEGYCSRDHLKKHMMKHPELQCPVCEQNFSTLRSLCAHVHFHNCGPLPCKTCGQTFYSSRALLQHIIAHVQKYECNICHADIKSKHNLTRHKKMVHGIGADT